MNTIDDLRATLAGHAELHDDYLTDRVRAVNGRVRTVRRRRAAVAVGTAAVVLAGVVGGVAIVNRPDPGNDNLLAGQPVPHTMTSLGYTYEFVEGEESAVGEHTLRVEVPASDVPRLVSWATEGDGQRVRVSAEWGDDFVSGRDDFRDFVVIPEDESGWVEVKADSQVALATYELGDERPAGYTKGDVTFRQQSAGDQLVGAVIGDRGDTEVNLTFTVPEGRVAITDVCQATESGSLGNDPWIDITFATDGVGGVASSCGTIDEGFIDGGTGGWEMAQGQLDPGDEVTITARITESDRSTEPIEDPHALLGIAVYAAGDTVETSGNHVDRTVEHDGHTFVLRTMTETSLVNGTWSDPVPSSRERILVGLAHGDVPKGIVLWPTAGAESFGDGRGYGTAYGTVGIVPPGAERVGVRVPPGTEGEATLLFYTLAD